MMRAIAIRVAGCLHHVAVALDDAAMWIVSRVIGDIDE